MPTIMSFYEMPTWGRGKIIKRFEENEDPASELYSQYTSTRVWKIMADVSARVFERHFASDQRETELLEYSVPLIETFKNAVREYPSIGIDPEIMAGAPCIGGTRIPVYMVLDAIEYFGTIDGALSSYPQLTAEQVKAAIGFSKLVVECPIDTHEATSASR